METTREDAELALLAAVEDERIDGLVGHELAIALLHVLAEDAWLLLPRDGGEVVRADAAADQRAWEQGFRQGVTFGRLTSE